MSYSVKFVGPDEEEQRAVAEAEDLPTAAILAGAFFVARTVAMPSDTLHLHIEDDTGTDVAWIGGD